MAGTAANEKDGTGKRMPSASLTIMMTLELTLLSDMN